MLFLGIDPGLASLGYGLIKEDGDRLKCIDYGVVKTRSTSDTAQRLLKLYQKVDELLMSHQPNYMVLESLFFAKNVKTALAVGQARGVVILAAAMREISFYEYTPLQVKQAITGYGQASKRQIQELVKSILGLPEIPRPDDAADALAIALCHLQSYKMLANLEGHK